jgi:uncharacterized protein YcnI
MTLMTRPLTAVLVTAATTAFALFGAAPAWAHVKVTTDHAWRGGVAILTFEVPNESESGSPTTQLTVALPNVTSAHTEVMPGWTARLEHEISAGIFHSVTWTAAPPNAGIPPDQFALFRIEVNLPDSDTASFPATQTYADGTVVHWDQPPLPGGGEPGHPAPMLTLTKPTAKTDDQTHAPAADETARWLAGAALAVGGVAVVLALLLRRRT